MTQKKQTPIEIYLKILEKEDILDPWQERVLKYEGSTCTRCGRQVGKSFVISKRCAMLALKHSGTLSMIIAAAQRQSSELFEKTYAELYKVHEALIKNAGGWKDDKNRSRLVNMRDRRVFEAKHGLFIGIPTKTEMKLKNQSKIYSLPAGKTGMFIRCYTIDFLYGDEAAFIPEPVWLAITPMMAISKKMRGLGWTNLLSTPFGKGGYFYDCCHDRDMLQTHKTSEQCRRIDRSFLRKEKIRLTKREYAQEYLGQFVDDFSQMFPTALIKKCMTFISWTFDKEYKKNKRYYLGMDIARFGQDENAFVSAEMDDTGKKLKIIHVKTTERKSIPETVGRTKAFNEKFAYRNIFIDSAGVGGGVYDMLAEDLGKKKIIGLENATRTVEREEKRKKLLKEDLYSNALKMMESGELDIISNLSLLRSLRSMTFEYTAEGNLKIYGRDSHLAEAFVRVCWAIKHKGLKLFIV